MRYSKDRRIKHTKNISVVFSLFLIIMVSVTPVCAVINADDIHSNYIQVEDPVPVTILADYRDAGYSGVIQLQPYTTLDDAKIISIYNNIVNEDTWNTSNSDVKVSDSLCTCVFKKIDVNGEDVTVMGRNMDLPNSFAPVYVFEINAPDRYRSFNMGYFPELLETFDQIAETSSIDGKLNARLAYSPDDVMNEKGLIIETNIRKDTDAVVCTGTNPDAEFSVCTSNLARVLGDWCANIEEALNLVNSLNIYKPNSGFVSWHIAFGMMDATGRYGVLEFVDNKPVWHESQMGQTNFWIDEESFSKSDVNCGLGRWDEVLKSYSNLKTEDDFAKLMEKLHYSQFLSKNAADVKFDISTELTGESPEIILRIIDDWGEKYGVTISDEDRNILINMTESFKKKNIPYWTNNYMLDSRNLIDIYSAYDIYTKAKNQLSADARKECGYDQVSAISYTVNNKDCVFHVRFFEQDEVFHFGVTGNTSTKTVESPFPLLGVLIALCATAVLVLRKK